MNNCREIVINFLSNLISSILAGLIAVGVGYWIAKPDVKFEKIKKSPESTHFSFKNSGIIPGTETFTIASGGGKIMDARTLKDPIVLQGDKFVEITPGKNEYERYVTISNLPRGQDVQITVTGDNPIIVNNN